MYPCPHIRLPAHVFFTIMKCNRDTVKMLRCDIVKMLRCDTLKMLRYDTVKMLRCDTLKMLRYDTVKIYGFIMMWINFDNCETSSCYI